MCNRSDLRRARKRDDVRTEGGHPCDGQLSRRHTTLVSNVLQSVSNLRVVGQVLGLQMVDQHCRYLTRVYVPLP
jgi:hypothetical protein